VNRIGQLIKRFTQGVCQRCQLPVLADGVEIGR
jgi:hypothetical protein